MSEENSPEDVDVTKAWQATQDQKSKAKKLRLFAGLSWLAAIGGEIAGIVLLLRNTFDQGNMFLLIGILVFICLLYTSPSPRDRTRSRMPSSA